MRTDVNKCVQIVLTTGVLLSMAILLWGSFLLLMHPEPPGPPGSIPDIIRGLIALDPSATVNLGLLVLLLTPVVRVFVAMIAFTLEGDRKYALVSLAVLIILALSATLGKHAGR